MPSSCCSPPRFAFSRGNRICRQPPRRRRILRGGPPDRIPLAGAFRRSRREAPHDGRFHPHNSSLCNPILFHFCPSVNTHTILFGLFTDPFVRSMHHPPCPFVRGSPLTGSFFPSRAGCFEPPSSGPFCSAASCRINQRFRALILPGKAFAFQRPPATLVPRRAAAPRQRTTASFRLRSLVMPASRRRQLGAAPAQSDGSGGTRIASVLRFFLAVFSLVTAQTESPCSLCRRPPSQN